MLKTPTAFAAQYRERLLHNNATYIFDSITACIAFFLRKRYRKTGFFNACSRQAAAQWPLPAAKVE
ncbi:hypothetical protein [Deminuibacter soli]|uniref:Uncharacterized protein n=1 Tax=Deminuibacter soli TaxID=2291815 RepID=A0A3E1NKZ6_9BACT|nr:hypothetical protein [Deminuibacter soli]RFM28592.1 hypothetical protein DXN05_07290 [Deminuibacter soli]